LHITYSDNSGLQVIQRYRCSTHITIHRSTRTRVLIFTSRFLATDLSQSHCNFKSHMKSSCYSLIHFLPLFSTQFNSSAPKVISWQARVSKLDSSLHSAAPSRRLCPFITPRHGSHRKHSLYCYGGVFTGTLPGNGRPSVACVRFAGMCLLSRCLAMGIHVTAF
jgi:hypothetical protein